MKKFLLIMICLLLVGCTSKQFELENEYYSKNELIDINSDEFKDLIKYEKSFAVFAYTDGCSSCHEFKKVLEEYQKNNRITFYSISAPEMKKTSISDSVKYTPSMLIYNKGKLVVYLNAESDKDLEYYKTTEGFNKWFTKYVILKTE